MSAKKTSKIKNNESNKNNENEKEDGDKQPNETEPQIYIPEPRNFTPHQLQTTDNLINVQARFDLISQRFQGFESKLIEDRDRKLREQQIKIDQIKSAVSEIRGFLKELTVARAEHINNVSTKLTSMIDDWTENQPPLIHAKLDALDDKIDSIYDRLDALQTKIQTDYENFMQLIKTKVDAILKILNEFRETYTNFQANRTEKDGQVIEQLKELDRKYFTLFKVSKTTC